MTSPHTVSPAFDIDRWLEAALPHGFKIWRSHDEVAARGGQLGEEWLGQQAWQAQLVRAEARTLDGYCAVCAQPNTFRFTADPSGEVNWRESLHCASCGMINRWRASAHLFRLLPRSEGPIYLTEQTTSLFDHVARTHADVIGSEFVAPTLAPGTTTTWRGREIRHEDLTRLSFADASVGSLLSFDVLEHVPDWRGAVSELARVLKPSGLLLLTAPFSLEHRETTTRARLNAEGGIDHLLPPQYHGDPLSEQGVLCFQEFGWDLLDALRECGFSQARVISVWAPAYGYLGTAQPFVVGWR
jgi:SAM-dependent methyltransferase